MSTFIFSRQLMENGDCPIANSLSNSVVHTYKQSNICCVCTDGKGLSNLKSLPTSSSNFTLHGYLRTLLFVPPLPDMSQAILSAWLISWN